MPLLTVAGRFNSLSFPSGLKPSLLVDTGLTIEVPPTAKVIMGTGTQLIVHPESNLRPLVYKLSDITTAPWRLQLSLKTMVLEAQ